MCVSARARQMKMNSGLLFISVGFEDVFLCFSNTDKFIGRSMCITVNRNICCLAGEVLGKAKKNSKRQYAEEVRENKTTSA